MYKIITMEREFASGGNEIGRRVAKKLGIALSLTSQRQRSAAAKRTARICQCLRNCFWKRKKSLRKMWKNMTV